MWSNWNTAYRNGEQYRKERLAEANQRHLAKLAHTPSRSLGLKTFILKLVNRVLSRPSARPASAKPVGKRAFS